MKKIMWLYAILLLASRCGNDTGTAPSSVIKGQELLIFSAPWCEACETLIPELNQRLLTSIKNKDLKVQGLLVTSKKISQCPTAEEATNYQKHLQVDFTFEPDKCPREKYKKYFGNTDIQLPAAVLLRSSELTRKFDAGTFKVEDIVFALSN